jgi:hypothetical protein
MALFGSARDVSVFRHVNRELLWDIVTQQCSFYKYNLGETVVNIYGEASKEKYYDGPTLFNCLIDRTDQEYSETSYGVDFNWQVLFAFLKDDLVDANLVPEVGDIILYNESYYEVNSIVSNQLVVGKDPNYPNEPNPLNPGLSGFGYDVSIVVKTHIIPADKVGITRERM